MAKRKKTATKETVLYEKPSIKLFGGEKPQLTAAIAKKLLGWTEEAEGDQWGSDFLIKDRNGTKVRCTNDEKNRPISTPQIAAYVQEILNKRWQFTNETIGIGMTGQVVDGQHRLIALVLAIQEWLEEDSQWKSIWKEEPSIPIALIFGIDESDTVVNVINTGKPRSFSDVMYRSDFLQEYPTGIRKSLARLTDYAVKMLWKRTGESLDPFTPRKTHSESLEYVRNHPKILDCIKHIYEEDEDGNINNLISPGYASALLYLMASSDSDYSDYKKTHKEKALDFGQYDKACDFWVLVSQKAPEVEAISKTLAWCIEEGLGGVQTQLAVFCKAWNLYVADKPMTTGLLKPKHTTDEDGYKTLTEVPVVDGIDLGDPDTVDEGHIPAKDPTPEEIEERKTTELKKRKTKKKTKEAPPTEATVEAPLKKKKKRAKSKGLEVGAVRWVKPSDGSDPWRGKIMELTKGAARLRILQGFPGAGNLQVADLTLLRTAQPNTVED